MAIRRFLAGAIESDRLVNQPEGFSLEPEKASKHWTTRRFLAGARESELSMMTQRSTGH
ncbi:hypothetical protein A2U01_0063939, partial [Trifolium medium]|nr:hypothetical protein [Trifolium medium]